MKISDFLDVDAIITNLSSTTKKGVIEELSSSISTNHQHINQERLSEILQEREELCSTALDSGVAVPHGKIGGITDVIIGFGRSMKGIEYDSLDQKPTHFFITLVAPEDITGLHIQLLAKISKIFKDPEFRAKLIKCESIQEIYEAIKHEDEKRS
jgi:PTS system nitrogen regulatory IIA component